MKKETKTLLIWIISLLLAVAILIAGVIIGIQKENEKKQATQQTQQAQQNNETQNQQESQEPKKQFVEESPTMHNETDASGDRVPVPNGYVGSSVAGENEIDTGYVIYEGEEAVTAENLDTARKTRNQYVWVPVPDASKMYGTDSKGKKWGKLYTFSATSGDAVTGASAYDWSESNGVMSPNSYYREPDIVTKYDIDSKLKQNGMGNISRHKFLMDMEKEFNGMIASVEKYGGYYIGRYETGGLDGTAVVVKGDTHINYCTWYNMYKKMKKLKGSNENVETGMIWGCQWDRTLMWLIESGDKTKEQICKDSKEWGNYFNNSIEYINSSGATVSTTENRDTIIPAGSSEQTKANNIYDLAGNVLDWTMEAISSDFRMLRGGICNNTSTYKPASNRYNFEPTYSSFIFRGARGTLYQVILTTA